MSGNTGRVLRSNCRSHGPDCSCPIQELPQTPRRSRSISKPPSRASSLAPELTSHYTESVNSRVPNGYPNLFTNTSRVSEHYESTTAGRHYHETSTQQIRRSIINEEISLRSNMRNNRDDDNHSSRSLRFDDDASRYSHVKFRQTGSIIGSDRGSASPISVRDHSSVERDRSMSVQRMVKIFNIDEDEGGEIDATMTRGGAGDDSSSQADDLNGNLYRTKEQASDGRTPSESTSMAFSLNSSFGSTIGHESRISTSSSTVMTTTKTRAAAKKTITNGNHISEESRRQISMLRYTDVNSKSKGSETDGSYYNNNIVTRIKESCQHYQFTTVILTYVQNALFYVPKLIYWTLVNLFVCEKWLLHQRVPAFTNTSSSFLKRLLLFGLLFLLSGFLYSCSGSIARFFDQSIKIPMFPTYVPVPEPGPAPPAPPNDLPSIPRCCDVPRSNEDYEKLLARLAIIEKSQQEQKQMTEESYSKYVKSVTENLELKLHQEIQKIEPTKVIVEKQTVIEKITEPAPPPPKPEPLDLDKISNTLMPLILPLVMDKVKGQVNDLKSEIECPEEKKVEASIPTPGYITAGLNLNDIERLIKAAILKYDADKTGLPDLALEPAGGSILSTRCTKSSQSKNSVLTLWGWRVWSFSNSPRSIIQPGVVPGECWVVEGATAEVVIQLISPAVITGFTVEHIPKSISPYGKIDTAPRKFQVWGLMSEHDLDTIWDYGTFEYLDNDEPVQYFAAKNITDVAYPIVELKVLSNHGSVKSTCIYRFRVHGGQIDFKP